MGLPRGSLSLASSRDTRSTRDHTGVSDTTHARESLLEAPTVWDAHHERTVARRLRWFSGLPYFRLRLYYHGLYRLRNASRLGDDSRRTLNSHLSMSCNEGVSGMTQAVVSATSIKLNGEVR